MTKEQAIKHLKLMQSGARNAIRYKKNDKEISEEERKEDIEIYQDQLEALEIAIKALEQQPSEDCVSRQAVLAIAGDSCLDLDSYEDTKEFCDAINELPPVTPTHGTCKDCKYNVKDKRTTTMCDIGHRFYMREPSTFYCADFEKRGLIK